jgi:hypothetical protein
MSYIRVRIYSDLRFAPISARHRRPLPRRIRRDRAKTIAPGQDPGGAWRDDSAFVPDPAVDLPMLLKPPILHHGLAPIRRPARDAAATLVHP